MARTCIYGRRWSIYESTLPKLKFPDKRGVYLIRIREKNTKNFTVIYVGYSMSFRSRAYQHNVIKKVYSKIDRNLVNIQFLFFSINTATRFDLINEEDGLIIKLSPILNTNKHYGKTVNFYKNHSSKNKWLWLKTG